MAALVCDLCGGKLVMGSGGIAVCDSCGMEYSADRMKEKVQEIKGVVKVDNTHLIKNYLELAKNAIDSDNNEEAEAYCNKIIEIDPTDYQAWLLKGKASAWQSTIKNPRLVEGINAFAKSVNYAPENVKENIEGQVEEEIKKISLAMISLQAKNFVKWPDQEETLGLLAVINSILASAVDFRSQTGILISVDEIMESAATLINNAVIDAYGNVILAEYHADEYPDYDEWKQFVDRMGFCITLLERATEINKDNDNTQLYENLISMQNDILESCAYSSSYFDFSQCKGAQFDYACKELEKLGSIPDYIHDKIWHKTGFISGNEKASITEKINIYKSKIKEIEEKKEAEAHRRISIYWEEHAQDKERLEEEKNNLNHKISEIKNHLDKQVNTLNEEISKVSGKAEIDNYSERIELLFQQKNALNLLQGKKKKQIQEQIDQLFEDQKRVQEKIDEEVSKINERISQEIEQAEKDIAPLQKRIEEIDNEFTKER